LIKVEELEKLIDEAKLIPFKVKEVYKV